MNVPLSSAPAGTLRAATFRFEVTPPRGHPCCGGLVRPVEAVDDALEALGVVFLGAGEPIVLCAVDWTGLLNGAHRQWREALAEAAGTTPDRVAVHCVHQHNAPFACLETGELLAAAGLPATVDSAFFRGCLDQARAAVRASLPQARPITHVAWGQAPVAGVASNRRVDRDAQGRVAEMRWSACTDARLKALPDGPIDPNLRTVVFLDGDHRVAALHYYATHPMSFYGDGRVTSDFPGLARKRRQAEDAGCLHLYFTGAAGNLAAGKYNDGTPDARRLLTDRLHAALVASESRLQRSALTSLAWSTVEILPPSRSLPVEPALVATVAAADAPPTDRRRAAYELTWRRRAARREPLVVSALHAGGVSLLHLPGEAFVEYQLRAQALAPGRSVCTAAYGDGGPWYLPVREEYPLGGYEPSVAFCAAETDELLTAAMRRVLAG